MPHFVPQRHSNGAVSHRGIVLHAALGLHDRVFKELASRLAAPARVLDIAAGRGAFTRRLVDAGYRARANDLDEDGWSVPEVPLEKVDLNGPFSEHFGGEHDAVVAIEIIEHLENPCHFLRRCRECLKPGGLLLLTTPNVVNFDSRWAMFRRGLLNAFNPATMRDVRHMTVLPWWILDTHIEEAGFKILLRGYAGDAGWRGFKRARRAVLRMLLAPFLWDAPPGAMNGMCAFRVAKRTES